MNSFEGKSHYPIDLEELPPGWVAAWVGDLTLEVRSGFASGKHNRSGAGVPHLRPMNIDRRGTLDLETTKFVGGEVDDRRLSRGDVLLNNTNSPVLVGKTCPIDTDQELAFSNHMTRLRLNSGTVALAKRGSRRDTFPVGPFARLVDRPSLRSARFCAQVLGHRGDAGAAAGHRIRSFLAPAPLRPPGGTSLRRRHSGASRWFRPPRFYEQNAGSLDAALERRVGPAGFETPFSPTGPSGTYYRFLAHQLHYLWMAGFFLHRCVKHVDQASVSAKVLEKTVPLALPPLPEQHRIVEGIDSYLSRLDDAVANLERVQRNLKRYRASVLKAAVEGRLVPTEAELARQEGRGYEPASVLLERILEERRRRWEEGELAKMKAKRKPPKNEKWKAKYKEPAAPDTTDLPELPEGWCWTTVDAVGDVLLGRQRAPQYLTGRWPRPYLRVANIKDDAIDFSDVEEMDFDDTHFEKYKLQSGDILVSEGQSPHLVGQSAVYRSGVDGLCFQKTLHRVRPVPGGPSTAFAQLVFRAHVKTGVRKRLASITTNIAHLTLVKFKSSPFPLPPQEEQERLVAETDRLLTMIDAVGVETEKQAARCARLRQVILKWAFEGKLADQNSADEPASALLERIRASQRQGRRTR